MTTNERPYGKPPSAAPLTVRSGYLIGRTVRDQGGAALGRVVDLEIESGTGGTPQVLAVVITSGPWGRLLGYESPDERGPWLVSRLARWLIRRHMRTLPWTDVTVDVPAEPDPVG
jgi:hypothetical protein